MARHRKADVSATHDGTAAPKRTRKARTPGPLSSREKLSVARRITDALGDLSIVDQRGVIGVAGLTGPHHAQPLARVLKLLALCSESSDRTDVVRIAAACLGSAPATAPTPAEVRTADLFPPADAT